MLSKQGPLWYEDGFPVEWSADHYKRWTARVWRPARKVAAQAPDTEDWIAALTFYELRHSAISMALHSTLVMTKDGMNLHTLASYAGHDVQTMQRYYSHVIARYRNSQPIDLERECEAARLNVGAALARTRAAHHRSSAMSVVCPRRDLTAVALKFARMTDGGVTDCRKRARRRRTAT